MDRNSDTSMLSDELKPRRTPVPPSFGETVPRPSVPDLSIIETPSGGAPSQITTSVGHVQSALSHLSYNDWRQKTGASAINGINLGRRSTEAFLPTAVPPIQKSPSNYVPVSTGGNLHNQENLDFRRDRVEERAWSRPIQSAGKTVSYNDFKTRPTSAPAPRTLPVDNGVGRDHPLAKSAPPNRSSGHVQSPDTQRNFSPSSDLNHYTHQVQPMSAPALQPNGHGSLSNQLDELSLVPTTNLNLQQTEARSLVSNPTTHRQQYRHSGNGRTFKNQMLNQDHIALNLQQAEERRLTDKPTSLRQQYGPSGNEHTFKNQMLNHGHIACNEIPSHHAVPMGRENMCMYPAYCHAGKPPSPWSCAEHHCHPPVAMSATAPHPVSHMHSMPDSTLQPHPPHSHVSFDDLYKIVLAQNDQLKALQSQVERLLLTQDHKPAIDACCKSKEVEKLPVAICKSDGKVAVEEATQTSDSEEQQEDCQKMSIGVMTSFIHAVTYRGRVGRLDAVHNVSEHESASSNGNLSKQNKSSSDDCSSSSVSPTATLPQKNSGCSNCCKDCTSQDRQNEKSKKHISKNGKYKQIPIETPKAVTNSKAACPEGCICNNNPGVSAAITAVRGCQAVLASRAGMTAYEYSTFNGADLPTVTEQPVSPMSSIHVDLHDYGSSSSDESGSSESDENGSSNGDEMSPTKEEGSEPKPNGWTFYNNVLGQVNRILEERDSGEQTFDPHHSKVMQHHKSTDVSVSKRVAFEANDVKETPKHLKEMALKYLRENHPEELASNISSKRGKQPHSAKLQEMAVYNMPASNMSFATFRYLERYNLLPENFNPQQYLEATTSVPGCYQKSQEPHHNPMPSRGSRKMTKVSSGKTKMKSTFPQTSSEDVHYQLHHMGNRQPNPVHLHRPSPGNQPQFNTPTGKILDITTLRQQPKLL
ncbi:uncharacterized protein LOC117640629 [Thrips palmi]|uniref:Uncharacterized protein LOC117640629 n=1 Tax=Thrips palmi TaxID=161013 RepID=A0A6P8Y156_THRPL|nr:uncharacterized protein LOC117640629 [Thrips palmi]